MTTKIFKYPFEISDKVLILMPQYARVLSVQMQFDIPCLWALIDDNSPLKERRFRLFGTGHPVPYSVGEFIGTFQMNGGELVWHLFQESKSNG